MVQGYLHHSKLATSHPKPEIPGTGLWRDWGSTLLVVAGGAGLQTDTLRSKALGTEVLTFIIDLCRSCEARSPPHGTPSRSPRYWNLQQAVPGHGPMRIWWLGG